MRKQFNDFMMTMLFWLIGGVILSLIVFFFYVFFSSVAQVLRGL